MTEKRLISPYSGSWALPDTSLGRTDTPTPPTDIRLVREIAPAPNGRRRYTEIPCRAIAAGRDKDGIYWWTVRTITDEWILPADIIVCDRMPADTKFCGVDAA